MRTASALLQQSPCACTAVRERACPTTFLPPPAPQDDPLRSQHRRSAEPSPPLSPGTSGTPSHLAPQAWTPGHSGGKQRHQSPPRSSSISRAHPTAGAGIRGGGLSTSVESALGTRPQGEGDWGLLTVGQEPGRVHRAKPGPQRCTRWEGEPGPGGQGGGSAGGGRAAQAGSCRLTSRWCEGVAARLAVAVTPGWWAQGWGAAQGGWQGRWGPSAWEGLLGWAGVGEP